MNTLDHAAQDIGNITTAIKKIAGQTNLLALNATIEASSAGDAGKGFSVVANEIKELAVQSSKAADDIADRITGIQASTTSAVKIIKEVTAVISNIHQAVEKINQSIQQQQSVANSVQQNTQSTFQGVKHVTQSIGVISDSSNQIAKLSDDSATNIRGIAKHVEQVKNSATTHE